MTTKAMIRVAALAAVLPLSALAADGRLALLPSAESDLVPQRLAATKIATPAPLDRAPASFSWALDDAALAAPAPFVRESREYWFEADAASLRAGVAVLTTAPGAVLRLSPAPGGAKSAPAGIEVELRRDGRALSGEEAFVKRADTAQLNATGASFSEGTAALVLSDALGAGSFELAVPKADRAWLVHVFEPRSSEVLSLGTDRDAVLDGDTVRVSTRLASPKGARLARVTGLLVPPGAAPVELAFEAQKDGSFAARAVPHAADATLPGLWEIQVFAVASDGSVRRDAATAFNAVVPRARFAGDAELAGIGRRQALAVRVGVDVAGASRYDASGVLYATDAKGTLVPAAIAHAAAWLEPGARTLRLAWSADGLAQRGLGAPFEVRQLTLTDQATLGVVEKRARALRVE